MNELPEGFEVVSTPQNQPDMSALPDGFEIEQAPGDDEKTSYLRGLLQTISKGQTLGFNDEIIGALVATAAEVKDVLTPGNDGQTFGEVYRDTRDAERESQAQFAEESPFVAGAAEMAGGLATGGVGASKIAGAKVFQGGKTLTSRALKKTAAASSSAAPVGAVYGAGVSEGDFGDTVEGAAEGAAISAVAGPVLTGAVGATTRAGRGIANLFQKSEVKNFNKATQQIAQAMKRDGDTPETIAQKASDMGPEATVADAGGANLKRELERAASIPGAAPEMIEKRLIGRLSRSGVRVQQVFDRFVGKNNQTANKTIDDLADSASKRAAPLYEKAYAAPVDNTKGALASLLENPRIKEALPKAKKRILSKTSDDDAALKAMQESLDADNPNMILWDHVKRQLDDDASEAYRRGANALGKDISKNAKTLRDALDKQSPAYKDAREIWAGTKRAEEAFMDGMNAFKGLNNPLTGAAQKAADFNDLSESEKDLFRKGVSMAVRQIIRTSADTVDGTPPASLLSRIYGNKEQKFIIQKVIPTAEGRRELANALKAESVYRKTTNDVLRNSRTALRTALLEEPRAKIADAASSALNAVYALRGNFFAGGRGISDVLKPRPPSEAVNTEAAKRLLARGNDAIDAALKDVDKYLTLPKETSSAINRLRELPKDKRMDFLRANPDIKKEIDRAFAAAAAGLFAASNIEEQ